MHRLLKYGLVAAAVVYMLGGWRNVPGVADQVAKPIRRAVGIGRYESVLDQRARLWGYNPNVDGLGTLTLYVIKENGPEDSRFNQNDIEANVIVRQPASEVGALIGQIKEARRCLNPHNAQTPPIIIRSRSNTDYTNGHSLRVRRTGERSEEIEVRDWRTHIELPCDMPEKYWKTTSSP